MSGSQQNRVRMMSYFLDQGCCPGARVSVLPAAVRMLSTMTSSSLTTVAASGLQPQRGQGGDRQVKGTPVHPLQRRPWHAPAALLNTEAAAALRLTARPTLPCFNHPYSEHNRCLPCTVRLGRVGCYCTNVCTGLRPSPGVRIHLPAALNERGQSVGAVLWQLGPEVLLRHQAHDLHGVWGGEERRA